jgi:hypothetical protein
MKTECHFMPDADRYAFDIRFCHYKRGWAQCDTAQDAPYFGIWTNPFRLQIVTYAEGDVTIQTAASEAEYREAVRSAGAFYREQGHGFAIDGMCHAQIITRLQALGLGEWLH